MKDGGDRRRIMNAGQGFAILRVTKLATAWGRRKYMHFPPATFTHPSTHSPTHPPTHPPTHRKRHIVILPPISYCFCMCDELRIVGLNVPAHTHSTHSMCSYVMARAAFMQRSGHSTARSRCNTAVLDPITSLDTI
jgi:hypothetical protein